ncbi:uncharacterized protein LOC108485169 [Gossypium arboreum]|uniref:uncharacterized protein LOC108485169 n=1 Tax=Gossypium arboreum TaxID=29729 RepID=UPI0008191B84|nr:uncharacterized protein LOC108485169 [Gossypium arboreum]
MYIRFEDGLNDEIRMMTGGTKIRGFVVLLDHAQKMEEVYNRKIQWERRNKESYKRSSSKSISTFPAKKFRDDSSQSTLVSERSNRNKVTQQEFGVTIKPTASVGSEEQKGKQIATSQRSRQSGQSSATRTACLYMKDYAARSEVKPPTRTYAIRTREAATAPDVIAVTFYLFDVTVYALLDPRSTYSYVFTVLTSEKKLSVEPTDYDVQLTKNDAVVNCREKGIDLKCQTGEMIIVESKNSKGTVRIILAFSSQRLMRKGNKAFLAYILDTRGSKLKLEQLPVVNEFSDVFFKELSSLSQDCEVEFVIDVILGTAPISITPYRMAPTELKELKTQLQELLDKGFIKLSMSP